MTAELIEKVARIITDNSVHGSLGRAKAIHALYAEQDGWRPTDDDFARGAEALDASLWDRSLTHPDEFEDAEIWREWQIKAMRRAFIAMRPTPPATETGG